MELSVKLERVSFLSSQYDKGREDLFKQYAASKNESVWFHVLNLVNRLLGFVMNKMARDITRMACWTREFMAGSNLK